VLLCYVGNPCRFEAVIDIDQSDIDFVAPQQRVEFQFAALPGETFPSRIEQIAKIEREETDAKKTPSSDFSKALATKYQASAVIDDRAGLLVAGATGTARIRAGHRTLGQRIWRYVAQTFRFSG